MSAPWCWSATTARARPICSRQCRCSVPVKACAGVPMSELARKDGPGGWAVAATVMSLEGVVEIGTGFGLAGASEGTGRERAHRRQGSERRRACPLCAACLGDPGDGRPVHRSRLRAAPLPRPADARHRSEDERAARPLRPRHAPAEPPVPDARGIAVACSPASRSRWRKPASPSRRQGSMRWRGSRR